MIRGVPIVTYGVTELPVNYGLNLKSIELPVTIDPVLRPLGTNALYLSLSTVNMKTMRSFCFKSHS